MPSELERQLETMFTEAPEPDPGAGEKALHRALQALQPVASPNRGFRTAVLAFAAGVVLLVIAAGSLAAAGALHVSLGTQTKKVPLTSGLLLPKGADGISAIVYGQLSATTKSGFRLQGLPVTSAALSPHGLYVAAGIGRTLVALAPTGRRAWSRPTGVRCAHLDRACGTVASVAWAPDGLRVAYVVRTNTRKLVLHMIWGDGTHDTVLDRNAQGVTPSWRADSLALAYVGSGGRPIIYDLGHDSHHVISWPQARRAAHLAFAAGGAQLAIGTESAALLVGEHSHEVLWRGQTRGVAWLGTRLIVSARVAPHIVGRVYTVRDRTATLSRTCLFPPRSLRRTDKRWPSSPTKYYSRVHSARFARCSGIGLSLARVDRSPRTSARYRSTTVAWIWARRSTSASAARPRSRRTASRARPWSSRTAAASRPRAPRPGR